MIVPLHIKPACLEKVVVSKKRRSAMRAPLHIQPVRKNKWFEKEVGHESSFTHSTGKKKQWFERGRS